MDAEKFVGAAGWLRLVVLGNFDREFALREGRAR